MLAKRYQVLLLATVVLAAYYPANFAGFSHIDDIPTIDAIERWKNLDILRLFFPSQSGGLYYRPFLVVTFFIDKALHGLDPGFMHLENILMHLTNALLVYFIMIRYVVHEGEKTSLLPFTASMLFALHPVNTESVNWISGRSDLLACMFILASTLTVLLYNERNQKRYIVIGMVLFICAMLAKETALAFLPGFILMLSGSRRQNNASVCPDENRSTSQAWNWYYVLGGLAAVLTFMVFRKFAYSSNASRIGLTIMAAKNDWIYSMLLVLRAFGFYVKKMLYPFPLNFAIVEVDPLYEVVAVPLAAIAVYAAMKRTHASNLISTGMMMLAPAFILIFGQIAWTPYAERYLYISSAFCIMAAMMYVYTQKIAGNTILKTLAALVMVFGLISIYQRSVIWQNDIQLCKDTVDKSPAADGIRSVYARLLAKQGKYKEALYNLQLARTVPELVYDERNDMSEVYIYEHQGKLDDAIRITQAVLEKTNGKSVWALRYLVTLLQTKSGTQVSKQGKYLLNTQILSYNLEIYRMTKDPSLFFDMGKTAELLGDRNRALLHYRQLLHNSYRGEIYHSYAQIAINKLIGNRRHAD